MDKSSFSHLLESYRLKNFPNFLAFYFLFQFIPSLLNLVPMVSNFRNIIRHSWPLYSVNFRWLSPAEENYQMMLCVLNFNIFCVHILLIPKLISHSTILKWDPNIPHWPLTLSYWFLLSFYNRCCSTLNRGGPDIGRWSCSYWVCVCLIGKLSAQKSSDDIGRDEIYTYIYIYYFCFTINTLFMKKKRIFS